MAAALRLLGGGTYAVSMRRATPGTPLSQLRDTCFFKWHESPRCDVAAITSAGDASFTDFATADTDIAHGCDTSPDWDICSSA